MRVIIGVVICVSSITETLACTALAIDGEASLSGAAYATENVDCSGCDFRLTYVPPRNYSGAAQRPVYLQKTEYPRFVGYGRGEIYHPEDGQATFEPALYIPQVPQTFGYYESACPLMNDQGLGIGESSCAAMLLNKAPYDASDNRSVPVGYLDAAALMQLVLERCSTAKCGAELIGTLCEAYGYLPFFGEPTRGVVEGKSEWDDAGEAYTLADASGEAWVVHVLGGVSGIVKSVWAAQRVPKGHVAPVANTYTIGELPAEPNDDFLFARDIFRAALAANLWDGKGPFHFSRVFGPAPKYEAAPANSPPIPLYTSLRKWRLLNLAAPSLNLKLEIDSLDMPFSVKAERKLTRQDVMAMMRDHYAGTEFDMTQGILAGPWGTPFRAEGGPKGFGQVPRGISIMRSIYSSISETGPQGSRVWFAPDTAETSVYLPLDHRSTALAPSMYIGTYTNFTRESAFWAFDYVSNWMQLNYQRMSSEDVQPRQTAWQDTMDKELAALVARNAGVEEVSRWQVRLQERVVADWWKLADKLIVKWNDYERTADGKIGSSWSYPVDWSKMVGMTHDVHPIWVQPAGEPHPAPIDFIPAQITLPRVWDNTAKEWTDFAPVAHYAAQPPRVHSGFGVVEVAVLGTTLFLAGSLSGFAMGRRQPAKTVAGREPLLA